MTVRVMYETVLARGLPPFVLDDGVKLGCNPDTAEDFYPEHKAVSQKVRDACHHCPVRDACLEWALDTRQGWGMWGGRTVIERAHILKLRGLL